MGIFERESERRNCVNTCILYVASRETLYAHSPNGLFRPPTESVRTRKKLRGKNWVRPIGKSRRYETLPDGLRAMTALLVLREKVIIPVLAGAGKPKCGPKPQHETALDLQYRTLHTEMRNLFHLLGVAV